MMWLFIALGFAATALLFGYLAGGAKNANTAGLFFILAVLFAIASSGLIFVVRLVFN